MHQPDGSKTALISQHDHCHLTAVDWPLVLPQNKLSMSVIYILLAISIVVALLFFFAFLFAVRSGQYDDPYTPSVRVLFEDEIVERTAKSKTGKSSNSHPTK